MRSRRSRRSLKVSHTQTSVPCGTLNSGYNKNFTRIKITYLIKSLKKYTYLHIRDFFQKYNLSFSLDKECTDTENYLELYM